VAGLDRAGALGQVVWEACHTVSPAEQTFGEISTPKKDEWRKVEWVVTNIKVHLTFRF